MAGQRDTARYASDATALALTGAAAAIVLLNSRHLLDDLLRAHLARNDRAIELTLQAEATPHPRLPNRPRRSRATRDRSRRRRPWRNPRSPCRCRTSRCRRTRS